MTAAKYPLAQRLDLCEVLPLTDPTFEVSDPYRWLEDENSPQTQAWYAAQDTLFAEQRDTWALREHFAGRVRELLDVGYSGPPVYRSDRIFFSRREPGAEHGRIYVVEGGVERVLLDPMAIDPTGATTLDSYQPSKEGNLVAYQLSVGGSEESLLRVLDVATGEIVEGPIDRCRYSPVAWLRGEQEYYYVRRLAPDQVPAEERQYHRRVYLHRVGDDPANDREIFGAGRETTSYYGVSVSWDGRWLTLSAAVGTDPRNDVWLADLSAGAPSAPDLRAVTTGLDARTGCGVGRDGRLYVFTDLDAPRGRLAVTDPSTPEPERWADLLPERGEAVLEDYLVLDRGARQHSPLLVASWVRHAVGELTVHDLATGEQIGEIALPGVGTLGGLIGHPDGGDELWFAYSDYVSPTTIYRLGFDSLGFDSLGSGDEHYSQATLPTPQVWSRPPGEVTVPAVTTRQVEFSSADGELVRMFVLASTSGLTEAGTPLSPKPTILYGYGGFGHTMSPGFSGSILAWVEAGGVYAIAGLRGGNEEGEAWHRAGMLGSKQNVFDDFHAAGEALVAGGWTTPDQLALSGGSNGGLLVGATLTQWPTSCRAVVCSAPLLDMVRYQLHGLGVSWTGEYGDANSVEELRWLLAYSPYHRVVRGTCYPSVLFTTFAGDTRVDPLHAAKLCAALQHATSASIAQAPILLRYEHGVGHGARALSKSVALTADTLGFLAHELSLEETLEG